MTVLYKVVRVYARSKGKNRTIKRGLSLDEAQTWCDDPETSSKTCKGPKGKERTRMQGPWFDGYTVDDETPKGSLMQNQTIMWFKALFEF